MTVSSIPAEEWQSLSRLGMDAVWLMGVWERSPAGTLIARDMPELRVAYRKALTDYSEQDVIGSPYAVHRYDVDRRLGGAEALAEARSILARHGIRLILDFVPNHVARDHPWVMEHSDYFMHGHQSDLGRVPESHFAAAGEIIACGRDPYFAPWTDTAQLNAFHPGMRAAAVQTLHTIAGQCDGARCDMAMLFLNEVFARTWGPAAGLPPETEYWIEVIRAVRHSWPDFLFVAEAYWGKEWDLQQQGFDYCYDKRLYDRLRHGDPESIRLHLHASLSYQRKSVRFIENHDEERAAQVFPGPELRAAAVVAATIEGAKLFHEGQLEGRRVRLPVQLGRRPAEGVDRDLQSFYHKLLQAVRGARFHEAEWHQCECTGWPDNSSYLNLLAWSWRSTSGQYLVVVNFSSQAAQGRVGWTSEDMSGASVHLQDLLSGATYERDGNELLNPGLYVDLQPWGFHFLTIAGPQGHGRPIR